MLQIVVAAAGTVCGAGFAVFSRTVDRLPPVIDRNPAGLVGRIRIACCDGEMLRHVDGLSPWWTRSTPVTRTSALTRRLLGRQRVGRSQSCPGVAADCALSLITRRMSYIQLSYIFTYLFIFWEGNKNAKLHNFGYKLQFCSWRRTAKFWMLPCYIIRTWPQSHPHFLSARDAKRKDRKIRKRLKLAKCLL